MILKRFETVRPNGTFWAFAKERNTLLRDHPRDQWKPFYEVWVQDDFLAGPKVKPSFDRRGYFFTNPNPDQQRMAQKYVEWRKRGATLQVHTIKSDGKTFMLLSEKAITSRRGVEHLGEQHYSPVPPAVVAWIEGVGWYSSPESLEEMAQRAARDLIADPRLHELALKSGIKFAGIDLKITPAVTRSDPIGNVVSKILGTIKGR